MRSVTAAEAFARRWRWWLCNQLIPILAPWLAGKKTNQGIAAEIQKPKLEECLLVHSDATPAPTSPVKNPVISPGDDDSEPLPPPTPKPS